MGVLTELGQAAVRYSPEAEKGAIGVIQGQMFGIRRALERVEPKIPALLDGVYEKLTTTNEQHQRQIKDLITRTGIKPGDARLSKVIDVLEGKKPSSTLDPQESQVYSWARLTYNKYADMMGLDPNQKISTYFTHVVEPANWRQLEEATAGKVPYNTLSEADKARYKQIMKLSMDQKMTVGDTIDLYRKSHTQMSDVLRMPGMPQSVRNAFLEARKGFPVYSQDFYQVLDTYGRAAHRKLYLEPTIRQVSLLSHKLPTTLRDQLETRIRHGVLYQPTKIEKTINASFAPFDTFLRTISGGRLSMRGDKAIRNLYDNLAIWDIGFSPSPIKKHFVADMMSIYAELGEKYTAQGLSSVLNPKLRELAHSVGNVRERNTPLDIFEEYRAPSTRMAGRAYAGMQKAAFYAYSKVDLLNQYTAWIGAYLKADRMKLRLKPVADMVAKGIPLPEAVIEYANRVNRYTVPRQTPLDIPGVFTGEAGPIMRLALQFSSKKMQRAELVWDQIRRATRGEFGPIGRTLGATLMLTGLPFNWDEKIHEKTGLDPNRIPVYNVLGKLGFGLKDTLYALLPSFGPAATLPSAKELTGGPAIYRKSKQVYQEMKTGQSHSSTGEYAFPITPKESVAKAFGFDPTGARLATDELRKHLKDYRDKHISASKDLSLAYYNNVTINNDWNAFYTEMAKIQQKYPDVMITSSMLSSAVQRVEVARQERMERHAPREFKQQQMMEAK